jgi:hypothetical protein
MGDCTCIHNLNEASMELETVSLNAAAKMDGAFANSSRI